MEPELGRFSAFPTGRDDVVVAVLCRETVEPEEGAGETALAGRGGAGGAFEVSTMTTSDEGVGGSCSRSLVCEGI